MGKGMERKKFLNVGGNRKDISVPSFFDGWDHILLDIDPAGNPDIVCDALELQTLEPGRFHAVYCSHNLEHYYHHELSQVLQGFRHVLKPTGFALISVPDMESVMRTVVEKGLDLDDVLYEDGLRGWYSGQGRLLWLGTSDGVERPELLRSQDRVYPEIVESHSQVEWFQIFWVQRNHFNLTVVAFLRKPAKWARDLMGLTE